jgi:hypothetical protein
MVSVENFYWILYENLAKPVGLDCWYYFPFGTLNNLSRIEFHPKQPKHEHHILFHFDQEPIAGPSLGHHYDATQLGWSTRLCKILANSEQSGIKKTLCQERNMLDWYYFYHGFASLDWFADCEYIQDQVEPRMVFNSLNRLVRYKRSYRMALTARLVAHGLEHHGDISFHGTWQDCVSEMSDPHTELSDRDKHLIMQYLETKTLPFTLDQGSLSGAGSAHCGVREYRLWQHALWHLVNETVFYDDKLHLTEKVFRPIVCSRPFLLVAAPGNLAYLRSYGFLTFGKWIDESYDDEKDHNLRLDKIVAELAKLCAMTPSELRDMYRDMQDTLSYNKKHFFSDFKNIIVDELVDNFDRCLRQWNHARLDGRDLPAHSTLTAVKNLLLK